MTNRPIALIAGAGGQLGQALQRHAGAGAYRVVAVGRKELDISDAAAAYALCRHHRPRVVINAAAYTAVDRAESDTTAAFAVNAEGAGHLASAAAEVGARVVHVSTDFVFGGEKGSPYASDDEPRPVNVYGRSKLEGERRVLAEAEHAVVIRTSWVYSNAGHNFLNTMLRLMAERDELAVVEDQIGRPTSASGLAGAIWAAAADAAPNGILHWADAGVASWYDFAVAILEEARAAGLPLRASRIRPIPTVGFPTPAARPPYSVLACRDDWAAERRHWRDNLRSVLRERVTEQA